MNYYARFVKVGSEIFRLDTRIYLDDDSYQEKEGTCIAAIVAKNPGSACSANFDKWGRLSLAGDKLLPFVRNRFKEAFQRSGKTVPKGAFIRIWNMFYLCNKELDLAISAITKLGTGALKCDTENTIPTIVWFAWGGNDTKLNPFKVRFHSLPITSPFFFDKKSGKIVKQIPSPNDFAKHTQGLSKSTIVDHLASIL